jgi:hypothetical protein
MTPSECTRCNVPCRIGLSFAAKNVNTGKWDQWRLCRVCAKAEGEIGNERAQRAIEVAERAGA